jgi:hypothetical protein
MEARTVSKPEMAAGLPILLQRKNTLALHDESRLRLDGSFVANEFQAFSPWFIVGLLAGNSRCSKPQGKRCVHDRSPRSPLADRPKTLPAVEVFSAWGLHSVELLLRMYCCIVLYAILAYGIIARFRPMAPVSFAEASRHRFC